MSSGTSACAKCSRQFRELRYMTCDHGFCTKCIQEISNAGIMKSGKSDHVTCPSCSNDTRIPGSIGGVSDLPRNPSRSSLRSAADQATSSVAGLTLATELSAPKFKGSKLLWIRESPPYVWDADFLMDGSIIYIVSVTRGGKFIREIRRLTCDGEEIEDHFPLFSEFMHPSGISVNHEIQSVAISDWSHKDATGSVAVLTLDVDGQWDCLNFDLPDMGQRLTLTPSRDIICTQGNNSLYKMNSKGNKVWRSVLPDGDANPFVANDNEGSIIVSTPNSSEVHIYNNDGTKKKKTFPRQFVSGPAGVCTDSYGRVYISNKDGSVRLFTKEGKAIMKLVDTGYPGCVRVYKEKYLLVGTGHGLYMHELV